jgi:dTMP kinase
MTSRRPITGQTPGFFVSFEGTEGSGKSTQLKLLVERLRQDGYSVTENQEPGSTSIGKQIRRVLLDPANAEMASMTELLLMFASRAQAAAEILRPAIARGDIVVSDRFTDSTLAYQGGARGLGFDLVGRAHQLALGDLKPDLTICVVVDVEDGLRRARHRNSREPSGGGEDRIDEQGIEFHSRVLEAYRRIAQLEPRRFHIVDGSGTRQTVAERIWTTVAPLLPRRVVTQ